MMAQAELPEGCNFGLFFIEDEKLRPNPESKWLYKIYRDNGSIVVGVCKNPDFALRTFGRQE